MRQYQKIRMNVAAIKVSVENIRRGVCIFEDDAFVDEWLGHLDSQVEGLKEMCAKVKEGR
jgi:hypothetical protein